MWQKALPITRPFSEVGLFGNQNTMRKPTTAQSSHTVQRLKDVLGNYCHQKVITVIIYE